MHLKCLGGHIDILLLCYNVGKYFKDILGSILRTKHFEGIYVFKSQKNVLIAYFGKHMPR